MFIYGTACDPMAIAFLSQALVRFSPDRRAVGARGRVRQNYSCGLDVGFLYGFPLGILRSSSFTF